MDNHERRWSPSRLAVTAAIVAGLAVGSYGIASAASGSGSSSGSAAPSASHPWGPQRSDETPLTGDALAKVKALALAKVPGGTIVRVETDADGHAAYEAHMVDASGNPVTVYVDANLNVVSVESGRARRASADQRLRRLIPSTGRPVAPRRGGPAMTSAARDSLPRTALAPSRDEGSSPCGRALSPLQRARS